MGTTGTLQYIYHRRSATDSPIGVGLTFIPNFFSKPISIRELTTAYGMSLFDNAFSFVLELRTIALSTLFSSLVRRAMNALTLPSSFGSWLLMSMPHKSRRGEVFLRSDDAILFATLSMEHCVRQEDRFHVVAGSNALCHLLGDVRALRNSTDSVAARITKTQGLKGEEGLPVDVLSGQITCH